MSKFILGKKIGMTQVFGDKGISVPVTVVEAGPITVVQIKTVENDGYKAVKFGYGDVKEARINKPNAGQFKKIGAEPKRYLREFRVEGESFEVGQLIGVSDMFEAGNKVDVTGTSKGKGFQGVIKRYGFATSASSHGSRYHRGVGALAGSASPGKVFKGRKLPGHMGNERVTVQNLEIVRVDGDRNLLLIKGAVPGPKGGLLIIKETCKK